MTREPGTWHVAIMKLAGWTPLQGAVSKGTFPVGNYGSQCLCCNAETDIRLLFDPSVRHSASKIAIPRCKECASHVAAGNTMPMIMLGGGGAALLIGAIGFTNFMPLVGVAAAILAVVAFIVLRAKAQRAAMEKTGHYSGLEVVAIPGLVSVRSTNPAFIRRVCELNPGLASSRSLSP